MAIHSQLALIHAGEANNLYLYFAVMQRFDQRQSAQRKAQKLVRPTTMRREPSAFGPHRSAPTATHIKRFRNNFFT